MSSTHFIVIKYSLNLNGHHDYVYHIYINHHTYSVSFIRLNFN